MLEGVGARFAEIPATHAGAEYRATLGATPGGGRFHFALKPGERLPRVGDLTLRDGETTLRLRGARRVATEAPDGTGRSGVFRFLDRRWRWPYLPPVTLRYNLRDGEGAITALGAYAGEAHPAEGDGPTAEAYYRDEPSLRGQRRPILGAAGPRDAAGIVADLLAYAGEDGAADLAARLAALLPADAFPTLRAGRAAPMAAAEAILRRYGATLWLDPVADVVRPVGPALDGMATGAGIFPGWSASAAWDRLETTLHDRPVPAMARVEGGPALYQVTVEDLVPVHRDPAGVIRPLAEVDTLDTWIADLLTDFQNRTPPAAESAEAMRQRLRPWVFRAFRLPDALTLREVWERGTGATEAYLGWGDWARRPPLALAGQAAAAVTKTLARQEVLPILPRLLETDRHDGRHARRAPLVVGARVHPRLRLINREGPYAGGYRLDRARGLLWFDQPQVMADPASPGDYAPPAIDLTFAFADPGRGYESETRVLNATDWDYPLAILRAPSLRLRYVQNEAGVMECRNAAAVEARAAAILDRAARDTERAIEGGRAEAFRFVLNAWLDLDLRYRVDGDGARTLARRGATGGGGFGSDAGDGLLGMGPVDDGGETGGAA